MSSSEEASRDAILARLAASRAQIRALLTPPTDAPPNGSGEDGRGEFPRSRTMRALLSGRGLGAAGALAGGLLLSRPALLWKLVRWVPSSAILRMLVLRAASALGERASQPSVTRTK